MNIVDRLPSINFVEKPLLLIISQDFRHALFVVSEPTFDNIPGIIGPRNERFVIANAETRPVGRKQVPAKARAAARAPDTLAGSQQDFLHRDLDVENGNQRYAEVRQYRIQFMGLPKRSH